MRKEGRLSTILEMDPPVLTQMDHGKPEEQLLGYRTTGEHWGKQRAVVVTHNPTTARKQTYMLDSKLEEARQGLLETHSKVRARTPYWRDPDTIRDRYQRLCEHLHLPTDLFVLEFPTRGGKLGMRFKKDAYRLRRTRAKLGRNIVVSDSMDWSTSEIVQASLDRWQVEDRFRQSKNEMVSVLPLRHWTDDNIRCLSSGSVSVVGGV